MTCGLTMMKIVMGQLILKKIENDIQDLLLINAVIAMVTKTLVSQIGIGIASTITRLGRDRGSKPGGRPVGILFSKSFVRKLMISVPNYALETSKVFPFGYHI